MLLRLENISKSFQSGFRKELIVLEKINLDIEDGDFVILLGENGSGKSTLLNIIKGDLECDAGRIILNGENITSHPNYKRSLNIASINQIRESNLVSKLTLEELLSLSLMINSNSFNLMIKKKYKDSISKIILELRKDLLLRLNDTIDTFSGGEHQIITLLTTIEILRQHKSGHRLLLLDEHVAHLDAEATIKVLKLTKTLVKTNNITAILVTHNTEIAKHFGNRILCLKSGKIVFDRRYDENESRNLEFVHSFGLTDHIS